MNTKPPKEIAIPGIHEKFYSFFRKQAEFVAENPKILDAGAGYGAFSYKLIKDGYSVSACDIFPESFEVPEVECKKADVSKKFPYSNKEFDIIVAIEVMEHIHDHVPFFEEAYRILKPKGRLLVSTPNIVSLKSRFRFLFSGFYYSFKPLNHRVNDGLQHISSLTTDQYIYLGKQVGFNTIEIETDKKQNTSRLLMFLYPLLWFYCKTKNIKMDIHNNLKLLTGRVLLIVFVK